MHLIIASKIYGRSATRTCGTARLIFDPDHSVTPRTIAAPVRSRLVRGHYSTHAWNSSERTIATRALTTTPDVERSCAPISSPVAVNVSLRKEK